MSRTNALIPALAFIGALVLAAPARAQNDERALLSTFCDAGNIKDKTCTRAKGYPNAPRRGCDVTLNGDRARGKFIASGHALLVASYESGCEAHTTNNGGAVVFEEVEGKYLFRGYQPGMQGGDCVTVNKDAQEDLMVCLTGHIGQGILETGVALMTFKPGVAGRIVQSLQMLLRAEDTTGAFGADTVTCKERPPKYFQLDKLKAGPRPMTVSVAASYADAEIIKTACGKGFPTPEDAIGELTPGDAYVPEDHQKHGRFVIDLATRKVTGQ